MPQSLGSAWRSFWHIMTSNDRHASLDAPYRTGEHVALPHGRHAPLTSVATNAVDSRTDLSSSQNQDGGELTKHPSASQAYTPGLRSAVQRSMSDDSNASGQMGEIQMQNFSEGLPPPPPVSHSWKRIDGWVEDNYEELFDNLSEGCTQNDINELEHELDCTLPMEVRESLQVHDGQERGGLPTGIIFGCMLLDCEEIVQEWRNWRTVNEELLSQPPAAPSPKLEAKSLAGPSSSTAPPPPAQQASSSSTWRDDLAARQDSQPPGAIQKSYAHPAWIPLARDWGGNCLAVDLAPGPSGKWGQVIIMGRDFDCKYVIARSWAAFLAVVADDMGTPKVFVDEETGELKLREFKQQNVEPAYLNILRWRVDQKYGRKAPRKRPANGEIRINPNVPPNNRGSPYTSPADSDRGRSPPRFPTKNIGPINPRGQISSPLARVAEEAPAAITVNTEAEPRKGSLPTLEKLVSADTPQQTVAPRLPVSVDGETEAGQLEDADGKENRQPSAAGLGMKNVDLSDAAETTGEMKTVEI